VSPEQRKFLMLCIAGFVMGIVICNGISLAMSSGDGGLSLVSERLSEEYGEAAAIAIQVLVTGLVGIVTFGGTIVYYSERFGITSATLIHMVVSIGVMDTVAYILWWFDRTTTGILLFTLYLFMIYLLIWFSILISYRMQIKEVNDILERRRSGKE